MIDLELLDECREMARVIAPELMQHPLYVVDGAIFDGLSTPSGDFCLGWARDGTYVDFNLRAAIESWTTPGPIIALHLDAIKVKHGDQFRDGLLATFLHELAHVLPPSPHIPENDRADAYDCPDVRACQLKMTARAEALPEPPAGAPNDPHDVRFIRRCCHLYFRAVSAGWPIPMDIDLFSPWFCSWPIHYLMAALPELIQHRESTFSTIEQTPPPPEFSALWEGNLAFAKSFQTPKET